MQKVPLTNLVSVSLFDASCKTYGLLNWFGQQENYLGNHTKDIAEQILKDKEAFHNFAILASTCAIYMGYTWECEEATGYRAHGDLRCIQSQEFCHEHLQAFLDIFKKYAGMDFPWNPNRSLEFFMNDHALHKNTPLYREISDFTKEHPTIQQKMIGTFCRTLAAGGIEPTIFNTGFAFI